MGIKLYKLNNIALFNIPFLRKDKADRLTPVQPGFCEGQVTTKECDMKLYLIFQSFSVAEEKPFRERRFNPIQREIEDVRNSSTGNDKPKKNSLFVYSIRF